MPYSSIIASATLKVMVNGRLLGWAAGFNPHIRTPARRAQGIDTSQTYELMPTTYEVNGTLTVYRGRAQGGVEGLGMIAFARNLLLQKYNTIELLDRVTDVVVMRFDSCLITDQAWSIAPKGLVTGQVQFEGLGYTNEADSGS